MGSINSATEDLAMLMEAHKLDESEALTLAHMNQHAASRTRKPGPANTSSYEDGGDSA